VPSCPSPNEVWARSGSAVAALVAASKPVEVLDGSGLHLRPVRTLRIMIFVHFLFHRQQHRAPRYIRRTHFLGSLSEVT
jgi:hypothetical protein